MIWKLKKNNTIILKCLWISCLSKMLHVGQSVMVPLVHKCAYKFLILLNFLYMIQLLMILSLFFLLFNCKSIILGCSNVVLKFTHTDQTWVLSDMKFDHTQLYWIRAIMCRHMFISVSLVLFTVQHFLSNLWNTELLLLFKACICKLKWQTQEENITRPFI